MIFEFVWSAKLIIGKLNINRLNQFHLHLTLNLIASLNFDFVEKVKKSLSDFRNGQGK